MSAPLSSRGFLSLLSAQFLGALNDNLLKMVVSLLAAGIAAESGKGGYLSLVSGVFILPYLLFSGYAGFLADRFDKRAVLIAGKGLEIAVMILALGALLAKNSDALLVALFLAATQAAFFSPAKYGILPEMLASRDLARANGYLETSRYAAVIAGTALGGSMLGAFRDCPARIGVALVAIASLGALLSFGIAKVSASGCRKTLHANPWREIASGIRRLAADRALWPAVAGITWFESLAALIMLDLLLAGKTSMNLDDIRLGILGALAGVGVGLGCLLAAALSRRGLNLGLVPIGAFGTGIMLIALSQADGSYALTSAALAGLGISGGLFLVPLTALLQQNARRDEKGHLISTNNFLNMVGVLAASVALWLLHDLLGISPAGIALAAGLLTLLVSASLLWLGLELPRGCGDRQAPEFPRV
jgi:acyl-[acyl-carrier-protein]-phospholipid O-acyltransferase / long-chain-fatty-acid--[acyl-carrier-protein] ligase